ncbi:uncharacterized protein LOC111895088 [Lactuca sativa]|uniref:uncharacterized protein LOC111895088 n=1 Tax=Lactuca sativa TaxID=4236 RepID=UPI000CD7F1D6|nr:uncharacterized protein LOC111895088 [Lactuca sativa]
MCESEEEDVENIFFESGESSSSVDDAQYCGDIIREHIYKPDVHVQPIPFNVLIFKSSKLAIKMYSEYAEIGGFDVRLSTQSRFDNKIIKKKHVICNRGGKQKKKSCDSLGIEWFLFHFIAIDHQKKSVTVGAGLLSNESIESYSWLLKAFLKTHGKEPTLVLTDQDYATKQAIENISDNLFTNTDFRKRYLKFVWDINMKPDTMSRSESMNSFFNTYLESGNLLLNFMMNYDTAIQKQMNTQRELDKASKKASYKIQTPREIELQASKVEIKAEEKEINCSCEHFKRMGVLCRHAFTIMIRYGVKEIPERYILKTWRKDVISRNYRFSSRQSDSRDCENVKLVNDSYYNFESCLDIIRDDKKKFALFAEKQQMLLKEFESESDYTSAGLKSKTDGEVVCKLIGVSIPIPKEINIHFPQVQSNKGSGIKKRIPSVGEVVYENSKKEHRMSSECGKGVPQNLCTCPVRIVAAQSTKYI